MKIAIKTLGCKSNQYESNKILEKVQGEFEVVSEKEKADVYILNSCTVTKEADRKCRQAITHLKKLNPEAKIVVFGCGAVANKGMYKGLVDYVVRNGEEVLEVLLQIIRQLGSSQRLEPACSVVGAHPPAGRAGCNAPVRTTTHIGASAMAGPLQRTRAVIKIQDGCNFFCSYCIIPFARGRSRSFSPKRILEEILRKEKQGFKEIVLTGINVGTWQEGDLRLSDLIELILKKTKVSRIRLSSVEPQNFSSSFYKLLKNPRFCPHLHMSLQSGSDRILKLMRRHYSVSLFREVAKKIRKINPDIALTTDVIVGFPCESDKDFQETVDFVKEVKFSKVHVFPFSARKGTLAYDMKGQIPSSIKIKRSKILREIASSLRKEFFDLQIGKKRPVLFERKQGGLYKGYTDNYVPVCVRSKEDLRNEIMGVEIQKCRGQACLASTMVFR